MEPKLVGVGQSLPTEKSTPPVLSDFFLFYKVSFTSTKGFISSQHQGMSEAT